MAPLERDVCDRQGHWFALRVRPYKNLDNRIDGAVLALFDIDILKRSEQSAKRAEAFTEGLLDVTSQPTAIFDSELRMRKMNAAFGALLQAPPAALAGRRAADVTGLAGLDAWRSAAAGLAPGNALPPITIQAGTPPRPVSLAARMVPSPDSPDQTLLVVTVDGRAKT